MNENNDIILRTVDLTKKYDNRAVVDSLNIEIKKGLKQQDKVRGPQIITDDVEN